jgi:hypothetical protein
MTDSLPPKLLNLQIPMEIDLSKVDGNKITFYVEAADEAGGSGLQQVIITLDRFLSSGHAAKHVVFDPGVPSADGQMTSSDSFNDSTPTTANISYSVGPGTPTGVVTISSIWVTDNANHVSIYDTSQLQALGFNTQIKLVNPAAPTTPTASIVSGPDAGATPRFGGTSQPGTTVYVAAFSNGLWLDLGATVTGADGKWTLKSNTLKDGVYEKVTAWAVDAHGNASDLSSGFSFDIWSDGLAPPTVNVPGDGQGHVHVQAPIVVGTGIPNCQITLFADGKPVGSGLADGDGHWAILSDTLAVGSHALTATQTTAAGRTSTATTAANVIVDAPTTGGLKFAVGSVTAPAGTTVDTAYIQKTLDDIGARLNAFIDTSQTVQVKVTVGDLAGGAVGSAAASWLGTSSSGPSLGDAVLNLNVNYANLYSVSGSANPYLFAHELLHALGFNDGVSAFANFVRAQSDGSYFYGPNAMAINGGPVPLDASLSHLADPNDLENAHGGSIDGPAFSSSNAYMPYSSLDMAILKDLGWKIKPVLVSADGHTFVAGSSKPGFDQVKGTSGLDTLVVQGSHNDFTGTWNTAGQYILTNKADGTSDTLNSIERIQFKDATAGLDVDGAGGQIYRLYQAVFGRTPDAAGLGYWIKQGDHGLTIARAADSFVTSAEFKTLYGSAPTSTQIVDELYANVLHRAPDEAGFAYWKPIIESSPAALSQVLVAFSESAENRDAVAKIIGNGFEYQPDA